MTESALSDLKVLEFGDCVSAPYCGKLMADMGAEVIKIEKPGSGDTARSQGPFAQDVPDLEKSGLFAYLNTSKLSITLNVETPPGRDILKALVRGSDVLLENQAPSLMDRLGLTYATLEKINPRLIMTSVTPFGQTGPHRDYKAYELNTYHGCGYGYISTVCFSEPVMPPVKAGGRQSEFGAAQSAAVATMGAVHARDHMGAGQHIDISIQEIMAGQLEAFIEYWTYAENEMGGVSSPIVQPITELACKDGWVFVMCVEEDQFDRLIAVMGHPDWAESDLFQDRFARAEYADALRIFMTEWSVQYTRDEIFTMCQEARIPVGPAYSSAEVVESEHLKERGYFAQIDHPKIGRARYPGAPYRLSSTPWRIKRHAPSLGEHNSEIFCRRLGYSRGDLVGMRRAGII